jgi:hypothetical protein
MGSERIASAVEPNGQFGIKEEYLRLIKDPLRPIVKKKPRAKQKTASRSVRAIPTAFEEQSQKALICVVASPSSFPRNNS